MSPPSIVVVGLGMVGLRFCESVRDFEAEQNLPAASITVFSEEPFVAYNRVGLTQYFTHYDINRLLMQTEQWYNENNVTVHKPEAVVSIDRKNKTVTSETGRTVSYDFLVIATGSEAFVPPIPRVKELDGVFVYRSIDDVRRIQEYSKGKTTSAVIGGGLLGLEAAKVCTDLGLSSFVIERNPRVLARQLDDEGSKFLIKELKKLNLSCFMSSDTNELLSVDGKTLTGIKFTPRNGEQVCRDLDMLIIATGIVPRDAVAKAAGLECGARGGVLVDDAMKTSDPNVFAIGEVACHRNMVYGLVAPGYDMAAVAAKTILAESTKPFKGADMSTKLKLMGVHVASFGDYFADESASTALTFRDPFAGIYKKLIFSNDGKKLLGGMLVGDTSDYSKLLALTKSHKPLPEDPHVYLVGKKGADGEANEDLPDDAQVCSCNNITKGDIKATIKTKQCTSLGALRACSKAGTGCGGCIPQVSDIFNAEMKALGVKVKNDLCEHFEYSRRDLYEIVRVTKTRTFADLIKSHGKGGLGCEVCKPAVASILASLWNDHVLDESHVILQDTNDRFLANIQRGGSYSVVPRMAGGEVTPAKLKALAEVAEKYKLYTKVTGGQRIDLFGAQRQDLPSIWSELVDAGFESGHAYGKSLRTVKSCVGSTWCRYGRRDSVGFAIAIEQRYKGIRSPHKLKGGVSGCVRECAEAQGKDFGLIATDKGYNLYVCGNGGASPKHAVLLAADVPEALAIKYLDRFLMYYIATADKLQRTARWLEKLEGGIDFLKSVVVDDRLGIAQELESQMQALASSYFCEWTEVVKNPERWEQFKQFANTEERMADIEFVDERGQRRPADWKKDVTPGSALEISEELLEEEDPPREFSWNSEKMRYVDVGSVDSFPANSGRAAKIGDVQIAVFRIVADGVLDKWYATQNMCPHKRAMVLSSSLVGSITSDDSILIPKIACPNHKKTFSLETGKLIGSDEQYAIATFKVRVVAETSRVEVLMPEAKEVEEKLGTSKWIVRPKKLKSNPDTDGYKALWNDGRSRRGKYDGSKSTSGMNLPGDIGGLVGGNGCEGACGDKNLEW
ncbi:hypothetical protein HDU83_003954 [Entophlyctis luteolus]|nr:hypothetical protein HDU83_003954 [Entophlyctis luteolus]